MMQTQSRPAVPADNDFLAQLYASTRAHEIAALGWPVAQQQAFLSMQFSAQQRWYSAAYPSAEHQIIEMDKQRIGRMIVLREPEHWQLIDISLLPEYRSQGIGGELIRALLADCAGCGAVLRLQVLRTNPALRLYQRLGFITTGEDQIYLRMESRPALGLPDLAAPHSAM